MSLLFTLLRVNSNFALTLGYPNPASNNRAQGFSALISCYSNYSWVCCNCCKGVVWLVWGKMIFSVGLGRVESVYNWLRGTLLWW